MIRLKSGPAAIAALCLFVCACDGGPSAVPVEKAGARDAAPEAAVEGATSRTERYADRAPAPQVDGKPMWSATRRFTAEQNAQRVFERNGEAFEAKSVDAFVRKAHAFVSNPPRGSKTLKRANGDTVIYDPAGNVFAVVTREGAPRTMFRPDEGPAYWEKVKAQEATRTEGRRQGGEGEG